MTYSEEWNDIYARGEQVNQWPWTDLVSAVKRYCGDIEGWRVLELGCGSVTNEVSCNSLFFTHEGAEYVGLDASFKVYEWIGNAEYGSPTFAKMDFTKELPEGPFDLIVDRAAVTHNDTKSIRRCLDLAYDALKPGGWMIGVDWFSTLHTDRDKGTWHDDYTRRDIPEGQFKGCGIVHFSNFTHLEDLFERFTIIDLCHKQKEPSYKPIDDTSTPPECLASWDIVARRET